MPDRGPDSTSEVLRETELASSDDVLLYFGGAATDGVDHGVAVRRLRPAFHRSLGGLHSELASRPGDVHGRIGKPLGQLGGEQLVFRRPRRRRRTTFGRLV